jgi:hypothetical protein
VKEKKGIEILKVINQIDGNQYFASEPKQIWDMWGKMCNMFAHEISLFMMFPLLSDIMLNCTIIFLIAHTSHGPLI